MTPRVAVIIPAYNAEEYLPATLKSLLDQTYTHWRAIIVDDGSSDATLSIARKAAEHDKRFTVISNTTNQGLSLTRNRALDALDRGDEWITFLDADDLLHPDFLSDTLQAARLHKAKLVWSPFRHFTRESSLKPRKKQDTLAMSGYDALEMALYQTGCNASANAKLFHASLWRGVRFTPGILYEDLDVIWRPMTKARRVALLSSPRYGYRMRSGSITHTFSPKRADVLDVATRVRNEVSPLSPTLAAAASDRLLSAAFDMYMRFCGAGGYPEMEMRTWDLIVQNRRQSLQNSRVRLKNKAGILLSYLLGRKGMRRLARLLPQYNV